MKRLATLLAAACALTLTLVAIAPTKLQPVGGGVTTRLWYYPGPDVYAAGPAMAMATALITAAIGLTPIIPIGVAATAPGGGAGATSPRIQRISRSKGHSRRRGWPFWRAPRGPAGERHMNGRLSFGSDHSS